MSKKDSTFYFSGKKGRKGREETGHRLVVSPVTESGFSGYPVFSGIRFFRVSDFSGYPVFADIWFYGSPVSTGNRCLPESVILCFRFFHLSGSLGIRFFRYPVIPVSGFSGIWFFRYPVFPVFCFFCYPFLRVFYLSV